MPYFLQDQRRPLIRLTTVMFRGTLCTKLSLLYFRTDESDEINGVEPITDRKPIVTFGDNIY